MRVLDLPFWLIASFLFVLGAIWGSFLNVCIHRFPQEARFWQALRGIVWPPSGCPRCRSLIRWHDNLPIIGWIMLRGRCRDCKMWISPRYPLIELLNAVLFVVLYWYEIGQGKLEDGSLYSPYGPQIHPGLGWLSTEAMVHLRYLFHLILLESLLIASFIDLKLKIIPDPCTLPALAVGVLGHLLIGRLHIVPVWIEDPVIMRELTALLPWLGSPPTQSVPAWIDAHPHWHGLAVSLAGALVGGGVTLMVRVVGRWILKKEAMGDGDVVLMAVIGSFLGWQASLMVFALAPACALVVVATQRLWRSESVIPYGPYLSLAALIVMLNWQHLWVRTQQYFLAGRALIVLACLMTVAFAAMLSVVQLGKRLFGLVDDAQASRGVWTAADQNFFFAGERCDRHQGMWRKHEPRGEWPGKASSQGTLHFERWRHR